VLDRVYRAVAWQRVDQIRYNIEHGNNRCLFRLTAKVLLALDSKVILGAESHGAHGHGQPSELPIK
jgi:hypothetical protein